MTRYLVERTFVDGLSIPADSGGAGVCSTVVGGNAKHEVTWIHSYVDATKTKTYCIYDGPNEQSIREAAETNGLPIDGITEVRVLDPYFSY